MKRQLKLFGFIFKWHQYQCPPPHGLTSQVLWSPFSTHGRKRNTPPRKEEDKSKSCANLTMFVINYYDLINPGYEK